MNSELDSKAAYVLGIDLGVASLGWACVGLDGDMPRGVIDAGVRIFEAGVEGDVEQGKDSSRAAVRRQKRQPRRQLERRARRQRKIFRLLQRHGLLPAGVSVEQAQIDAALRQLDASLMATMLAAGDPVGAHVWPYRLRAAALDRKLEPFALGRALYHLAQRRGFLSNRKTDKDDAEAGAVKAGIAGLARDMQEAGKRTLGEYFASVDPQHVRIRQRWTARDMYVHEFQQIWETQAPQHPQLLTPTLKRRLEQAMFRQRPLKSAAGLVGRCELEPERRRTTLASPLAQRFRLLAAVNNLLIVEPSGTRRGLTNDERSKLIQTLERRGDTTFHAMRKLLGLKKASSRTDKATGQKTVEPGYSFNLEEGGETRIPGNRTAAKLIGDDDAPIFGDRWFKLTERQQEQIVQDLLEYQNGEALAQRAVTLWGLTEEAADRLKSVKLEQGYARFSRRALLRLVPRMEEGLPYMTARKDEFPGSLEAKPALDCLPPVVEAIKDLRNPAVMRSLTELRKVINAIIRKHGKPALIRIELARDLRQARKQREQAWKRNRQREDERTIAAEKIKAARLVTGEPSRDAIEKWLLADECNWMCPYTGKTISPGALLGPHPQFDVEHIVPFSISLDNTFLNKTLCDVHFNRHRKMNRLPAECFDPASQDWHEVLLRVRRFHGSTAAIKLERFQWTSVPEEFTNRHLQDTRYASRLAGEYVGLLFGGSVDAEGTRRIQVSAGGVTAFLRNEWGLNGILDDGGYKTRDDHRHHAVDAVAIALTSPAWVKALSDAAEQAAKAGRRRFAQIAEPWPNFVNEVRDRINSLIVSHRVNHRVNGPLHEETNYSRPQGQPSTTKANLHHVRKPLFKLSTGEVKDIVDDRVREIVQAKLAGGDPAKVFADAKNLPVMKTRDGREIPIKKVRIRKTVSAIRVGSSGSPRYVAPGSNHHMVIVATVDEAGRQGKWEGRIVNRFEAMQRLRRGQPVVERPNGGSYQFKFSLCPGDAVRMLGKDQKPALFRVASISEKELEFRPLTDARPVTVIRKEKGARIRSSPAGLRDLMAQKVTVSPLGEIWPCHD